MMWTRPSWWIFPIIIIGYWFVSKIKWMLSARILFFGNQSRQFIYTLHAIVKIIELMVLFIRNHVVDWGRLKFISWNHRTPFGFGNQTIPKDVYYKYGQEKNTEENLQNCHYYWNEICLHASLKRTAYLKPTLAYFAEQTTCALLTPRGTISSHSYIGLKVSFCRKARPIFKLSKIFIIAATNTTSRKDTCGAVVVTRFTSFGSFMEILPDGALRNTLVISFN